MPFYSFVTWAQYLCPLCDFELVANLSAVRDGWPNLSDNYPLLPPLLRYQIMLLGDKNTTV